MIASKIYDPLDNTEKPSMKIMEDYLRDGKRRFRIINSYKSKKTPLIIEGIKAMEILAEINYVRVIESS